MPRVIRPLRPADPVAPITTRPPTGLGPEGRLLWKQAAPLPWVGGSDAMALLDLCRLADLAATLRADLVERGPTYECRGRTYSNPSTANLLEAERVLAAGLTAFGLSPASRGKLGVSEPQPATKLELLMQRREDRRQSPGPSAS